MMVHDFTDKKTSYLICIYDSAGPVIRFSISKKRALRKLCTQVTSYDV